MEKKHWRDTYKSDFLASWDLDGKHILTISSCQEEECKLAKGKEKKVVARFTEKELSNGVKVKPMILNPTNCKFLQTKTGFQFPADWIGFQVEISAEENKGGIGEKLGLRITKVVQKKEFDIKWILEIKNIDEAKKQANLFHVNMSDEQKKSIRDHITKLSNEVQS